MARIYVRVESASKAGTEPTPGEQAAALRVANAIAEALGLDATGQRKGSTLRGVTLRLDSDA